MHKALGVLAEARPEAAFLSFDASNAFNTISRRQVCQSVSAAVPVLGPMVCSMYGEAGGSHLC